MNFAVSSDKGYVFDQSGCADNAVDWIFRITNWELERLQGDIPRNRKHEEAVFDF